MKNNKIIYIFVILLLLILPFNKILNNKPEFINNCDIVLNDKNVVNVYWDYNNELYGINFYNNSKILIKSYLQDFNSNELKIVFEKSKIKIPIENYKDTIIITNIKF